ncbi:Hypothetical Protein MfeM64YM_0733 [Mycoplasmopsis fermentans M64]|uniref:Uncharacterized protein n=1 Tax=Mycoplasmopsis fermentans (strain M64) TaxID=943945 RepID=A0AB32XCC7_MYCFM|nr:Hypothetical Protein MfeM64YM_0733 [Mycoplasmopsis fermentans M64]
MIFLKTNKIFFIYKKQKCLIFIISKILNSWRYNSTIFIFWSRFNFK